MNKLKKLVGQVASWLAYAKKAVAAASAAIVVTGAGLEDNVVTTEELIAIVSAWAGVVAVFWVTNSKEN